MTKWNDEGIAHRLSWPLEWVVQGAPRLWERASGFSAPDVNLREVKGGAPEEWLESHHQDVMAYGEASLAEAGALAPLVQAAQAVSEVVQPIQPDPHFRAELRRALLATHRQQAAQRSIFDQAIFHRVETSSLWSWQMAATVPVVLGIVALLWRRSRNAGEQTAKAAA